MVGPDRPDSSSPMQCDPHQCRIASESDRRAEAAAVDADVADADVVGADVAARWHAGSRVVDKDTGTGDIE